VSIGRWLALAAACGVATLGLLLASWQIFGDFALFAIAVLGAFLLVKRYFDDLDRIRH
jgi:hypothetical protein